MIVYISTEMNSQLFDNEDVFSKTYIKWQYDVEKFVKEEYANILSVHPDAIIIDYIAFENINKLTLMKDAFPNTKIIVVVDAEDAEKLLASMKGFDVVLWNNDTKNKILNIIYPERKKDIDFKEIKIGITSDLCGAQVDVAFNLLVFLSKYTKDVCYIEVAEKSVIPGKYERKMRLESKDGFYEYKEIPILFNIAKSGVKISVFSFEQGNRKMFERCDYPLELKKDKLIYNHNSYDYPKLKHLESDDRTKVYRKIFENKLGFNIEEVVSEEPLKKFAIREKKINEIIDKEKIRIFVKGGILIFSLTIIILIIFFYGAKSSKSGRKSVAETVIEEMEINTASETTTVQIITTMQEETKAPEETVMKKKKVVKKKSTSKTEKVTTGKKTEIYTKSTYKNQTTTKAQSNPNSKTNETAKKNNTAKKNKSSSKKKEVTTTQPFEFKYKID